jgi:hypothetical protein
MFDIERALSKTWTYPEGRSFKSGTIRRREISELCKLLRPVGDSGKNVKRKITLDSSLLSWRSAVPKSDDPIVMGSEREFRDLILPTAQSKDDFFVLGAACLKSAADEAARLQFVMTKKPSKEGVLLQRLPPSEIKALDRWIAKQKSKISRPEAIRQIYDAGAREHLMAFVARASAQPNPPLLDRRYP